MTCGVYKIVNSVNGKMYIGQSLDIEARWKRHIKLSETHDGHLYSAIRKYGLDNFTFSIICEVPESALDQYEISYIKYYETTDRTKGYNKQAGGANGKHCEETKTKMSESHKGKSLSDETKKKISDAGKNMSDETKTKMSESHKGKSLSDETKKKISDAGKNMSDETKTKMSDAKRGNQHNLKQYQYQGIVYNGMKELANFLGLKYQTLSSRIIRKLIDVTILSQSQKN